MQTKNPRPFIEHHVISAAEAEFSGVEVKAHPQGGFTLALPAAEGTTVRTYSGNFPTPRAAEQELTRRKMAAIAARMHGTPAAKVAPAPVQGSFF